MKVAIILAAYVCIIWIQSAWLVGFDDATDILLPFIGGIIITLALIAILTPNKK